VQHAPVVDYERIAGTKESDRQWGALRKPVSNLGVGGVTNSACRPEKYFIPSKEIGVVRGRFKKAKQRKGAVAWPTWLDDRAREKVPSDGIDECAAVDQRRGDVLIANQASQQQVPRWPAPVGEIGMKWEAPQAKISAVCIRSSVFTGDKGLHKATLPRRQRGAELVGDVNNVGTWAMLGD